MQIVHFQWQAMSCGSFGGVTAITVMSREEGEQQNPLRSCVALCPVTPRWPPFLILLLDTFLLVFENTLSVIHLSLIDAYGKKKLTILGESQVRGMEPTAKPFQLLSCRQELILWKPEVSKHPTTWVVWTYGLLAFLLYNTLNKWNPVCM